MNKTLKNKLKASTRTKRMKRKVADPVFNRQFWALFGDDLQEASRHLHTHTITIKRWLTEGCNNECARLYINLLFRGGIPDRDGWHDWRFCGDKIVSPEGQSYKNRDLNRWTIEKVHYAQLIAFEDTLRVTGLLESVRHIARTVQSKNEALTITEQLIR